MLLIILTVRKSKYCQFKCEEKLWHLQGLITELEKGLGSIMRRKDPSHRRSSSGGQEDDFDALASILTPIDETQYWADVANATKKKEERDKAGAFWNTLEPVAEEFQKISTMQLPGSITTYNQDK